jgi:hypothetical protein
MSLYSHYDGAHNHPVNRALHLIAIPVGFSSVIVVVSLDHRPPSDSHRFCAGMAGTSHRRQQARVSHQSSTRLRGAGVDGETDIWETRRYPHVTNRSGSPFLLALRLCCNYSLAEE